MPVFEPKSPHHREVMGKPVHFRFVHGQPGSDMIRSGARMLKEGETLRLGRQSENLEQLGFVIDPRPQEGRPKVMVTHYRQGPLGDMPEYMPLERPFETELHPALYTHARRAEIDLQKSRD